MIKIDVEKQANMYVFDLNNSAKEHWFKATEGWELSLATDEERTKIEKKYNPTLIARGLPETLLQLHGLVKSKLAQSGFNNNSGEAITGKEMKYLIAYNPDRLR